MKFILGQPTLFQNGLHWHASDLGFPYHLFLMWHLGTFSSLLLNQFILLTTLFQGCPMLRYPLAYIPFLVLFSLGFCFFTLFLPEALFILIPSNLLGLLWFWYWRHFKSMFWFRIFNFSPRKTSSVKNSR